MSAAMEARLAEVAGVTLSRGNHKNLADGACVMEMVSYLAGEPWSDHPRCACPALTAYAIRLNDSGPQWLRDELAKRASRFINTRGSTDLQKTRLRLFAEAAIQSAERVLPLFEKRRPGDDRPAKAIQAAKDFLAGRISREAAADAAYARKENWTIHLTALDAALDLPVES